MKELAAAAAAAAAVTFLVLLFTPDPNAPERPTWITTTVAPEPAPSPGGPTAP